MRTRMLVPDDLRRPCVALVQPEVAPHPGDLRTGSAVKPSAPRRRPAGVAFRTIDPDDYEWTTRPHGPGEPARHVAELSERARFVHTRANVWRYEPGARGRRHRHRYQEETFVVLAGTLSMYVGEPPERVDVRRGGLIHVEPGTPLQTANHGDEDLVVYAYGTPPEHEQAEILASVV